MIQELLGVVEDRKMTIPSFPMSTSSSPAQSAASSPSNSSSSAAADSGGQQQNLRCPRCDSPNTKFCYYNNYNLTQPRHFCKTCRRYWTKGGALRNVPIGGGCRKTKAVAPPSLVVASKAGPGNGKGTHHKPMSSSMMPIDVMGRVVGGLGGGGGLDLAGQELLPSSPMLWASSMPHSSHLLSLLRASQQMQNPNPNQLLNSIRIKDEGGAMPILDHHHHHHHHQLGQLGVGSNWKNENNQFQYQQPQQPQPQQNLLLSEVPTSAGIQELYQRLRSSTANTGNNYCNIDHLQLVGNNGGSAAATTTMATMASTASAMEPMSLTGHDFGYWNPAMLWNDVSTTNGAFPLN